MNHSDDYYKTRPNLDQKHPKIAVLFLACSGSGKSTVRTLLVDRLGATYVCNDEVRALVRAAGTPDLPVKPIVDETWQKIVREAENHFIIFDSNLSSYYMHADSYLATAKNLGFRLYIIAIDLPKEELERRVINRQRYDTKEVLELLPSQLEAQKKAMSDLKSDFTITRDTNYETLVDALSHAQN